MSNTTTNISDLPSDPAGGGLNNMNNGNISISIQENMQNTQIQPTMQPQTAGQNSSVSLDQTTINQIVNGLQKATVNGLTQLPSRDIPRTTDSITNDAQIQPNYIPEPNKNQIKEDYINQMQNSQQSTNEIIDEHNKKTNFSNSLDNLYEEIQTPLLLAILFFIFQLPIFKKYLFIYLPFLFFNDGNYNLKGYVIISILFGCIYYFSNKVVNIVSF
jgi:hypothetical protein